jgi:hypothetical protein
MYIQKYYVHSFVQRPGAALKGQRELMSLLVADLEILCWRRTSLFSSLLPWLEDFVRRRLVCAQRIFIFSCFFLVV